VTDFERWLLGMVREDPARYRTLVNEWVATLPAYDGPADGSDVLPPGAPPVTIPEYWKTPIHLEPGGFGNPQVVRLSHVSKIQYYYTREESVLEEIRKLYAGANPQRILDIGAGTGTTALCFAQVFPNAEVIGIDLSAPYIRFARQWAAERGITNVKYYQQNAQHTIFEDASFDIVHFTYVLHEMYVDDAKQILRELYRLTKRGGRLSMFDGTYPDTEEERAKKAGLSAITGVEPYLGEYMKLNVERAIAEAGFLNVTRHLTRPDGMIVSAVKAK
jgi:ubiquinone/menaquinone biosynthesis C-methylase UbiE